MTGTLDIVVGGQFGSEGKGAIGAWLAREAGCDVAVRVAGPNAGHSAYDDQGRKWALRQIPVAAVANPHCAIVLGAGSEIDEHVLYHEIAMLENAGIPIRNRLYIDQSATILTGDHIAQESGGDINTRLGSTAKGIGAARADRIWRQAQTWGSEPLELDPVSLEEPDADIGVISVGGTDTAHMLRQDLTLLHRRVMIEGTQGYGLGLHTEYYPQCTSSDCRAVDFAAMAGVTPWGDMDVRTWLVCRTFPIRVAGNSGPLHAETSWEALAKETNGYIQPEKTTVTQKVRRVGEWDNRLVADAVEANGGAAAGVRIALTFFDYWYPELAGTTDPGQLSQAHLNAIHIVERSAGAKVELLGTGPNSAVYLGDDAP